MEIPDILSVARGEAAKRTGARVYLLRPEQGDFRLDGRETPSFVDGEGLSARVTKGRVYVDMRGIWYQRAADAWNGIAIVTGRSEDPDAHLCASVLTRDAASAMPAHEEWPLLRALMDAPGTLGKGKEEPVRRLARDCARMLRHQYARALAQGRPLYALRGCAAMLSLLLRGPVPLYTRDFIFKEGEGIW